LPRLTRALDEVDVVTEQQPAAARPRRVALPLVGSQIVSA
jgi:hypothetical protein